MRHVRRRADRACRSPHRQAVRPRRSHRGRGVRRRHHRHRPPAGAWGSGRERRAQRGPGAVHGQGGRARPGATVRAGPCAGGRSKARSRPASAPRRGGRRPRGPLPAAGGPEDRPRHRLRGAAALDPSRARANLADGVHPHRRKLRADRRSRPVGAARGLPAGPHLAGCRAAAALRLGQCLAGPDLERGFRDGSLGRAGGDRLSGGAALPGAHRKPVRGSYRAADQSHADGALRSRHPAGAG